MSYIHDTIVRGTIGTPAVSYRPGRMSVAAGGPPVEPCAPE